MLERWLELMTFLTNTIILISFIYTYVWIERDSKNNFIRRHSEILTIGLAWLFLIFFHTDAVMSIANAEHIAGYGWTFLNFQIITVLYTLLSRQSRRTFWAMILIVGTWLIWICDLTQWWLVLTILCLMYVAHRIADPLGNHRILYYPFALAFAIPFF